MNNSSAQINVNTQGCSKNLTKCDNKNDIICESYNKFKKYFEINDYDTLQYPQGGKNVVPTHASHKINAVVDKTKDILCSVIEGMTDGKYICIDGINISQNINIIEQLLSSIEDIISDLKQYNNFNNYHKILYVLSRYLVLPDPIDDMSKAGNIAVIHIFFKYFSNDNNNIIVTLHSGISTNLIDNYKRIYAEINAELNINQATQFHDYENINFETILNESQVLHSKYSIKKFNYPNDDKPNTSLHVVEVEEQNLTHYSKKEFDDYLLYYICINIAYIKGIDKLYLFTHDKYRWLDDPHLDLRNSYKSFISHFNLIIDKNNKINISIEKHKYYDSSSYVKYQITSVHIPKFATSARMEGKRTKNYKARNRTRINKKKKRDRSRNTNSHGGGCKKTRKHSKVKKTKSKNKKKNKIGKNNKNL